ncbi:hypothetical protein BaRGS_00032455 [Batillaria attramentaria]|uniref:Uncharacterized protein n=1 Tax=Batillaria attramentaria TaxID=370345 RepID=A0ABD0JMX4_9CAEN
MTVATARLGVLIPHAREQGTKDVRERQRKQEEAHTQRHKQKSFALTLSPPPHPLRRLRVSSRLTRIRYSTFTSMAGRPPCGPRAASARSHSTERHLTA